MNYDAIIAGGGPVGLFLACELRLAGVSVLLLEKNENPSTPLKRGWMGARGLNFPSAEAFYRRGLLNEVKAASIGWMGGERPGMQFTGDGKVSAPPASAPRFAGHFAGIMLDASKVDFSSQQWIIPGPSVGGGMVSLEALESVLADQARELGVNVLLEHEVLDFTESTDCVLVRTNHGDFEGKWLIDFSPRVGVAWSPNAADGSLFRKLFGTSGTTSVRAAFGEFYTAIDATSIGVLAANAPYGTTYSSPEPPLFATPFIGAADGANNGQPFPYKFAPLNSSRSNPDPNINWPTYEPISGIPGYDIHNHTPYTEQWSLSIERQAGPKTVFDASYVGSETHRQRVLIAENPGNPALCLSLSQPSDVMFGTLTCGAFGEDTVYYPASGGVINGTRQQLGPNFGSNADQANIGHAKYNALELSARHTAGRLEFDASYTYSKSLDQSSNIGEEVDPFNPALSYAISAFDVKHNFVVSYDYQLPFDRFFHPNRLTRGWSLSGITHVSSGFPVTMINNGDNSLIGTNPNGVNNSSIDEPDYNGGPIHLGKDPRSNGNRFFNTNSFTMNALGEPGTSKRRFFYGPGAQNYDMAVAKNLQFTESKALLFRVEAFNVFNHTQFNGPQAVDGNIGDTTFGQVINAAPPRILQGALKFSF